MGARRKAKEEKKIKPEHLLERLYPWRRTIGTVITLCVFSFFACAAFCVNFYMSLREDRRFLGDIEYGPIKMGIESGPFKIEDFLPGKGMEEQIDKQIAIRFDSLWLASQDTSKVVKAESFQLVDKNGNMRALLHNYEGEPSLILIGENRKERARFLINKSGQPLISMYSEDGNAKVALGITNHGEPHFMLQHKNKVRAVVFIDTLGYPVALLRDELGNPGVLLTVTELGIGIVGLFDNKGNLHRITPGKLVGDWPEKTIFDIPLPYPILKGEKVKKIWPKD